jgi:hypothetical protein
MRTNRAGLAAIVFAASGLGAMSAGGAATDQPVGRVPSGVVAAHMIGPVVVGSDGVCQVLGYYAFIDGLGQPFAGPVVGLHKR